MRVSFRPKSSRSLLLLTGLLAACGGPEDDALELGMLLSLSAQAAVPPEEIASFELGVVRGLPNDDCTPFASQPVVSDPVTCPRTVTVGQLLELRDAEGKPQRKRSFAPALTGSGRQALALRVPVGADTSVLIQALGADGRLLGSGCAFVGRVTISSVEFNNRTAELNLHAGYAGCPPIIP